MMKMISPSLLSADFGHLADDVEMVNRSEADWFHIDVMDGHFVPNLSMGFPVIKAVVKAARKPLDVHLMIERPDDYIERFCKEAAASVLTVHYEACTHLHRTLQSIKSLGVKAGVALNPHTPVSVLEEILPMADMVLLMSVNPGFGGQKFIESTLQKTEKLKNEILRLGLSTLIEIDGGCGPKNSEALFKAGADVLVCGNSVFSSENPEETIRQMKR